MSSTHGNVCRFCMRTETTLISLFDGNNDIPKKLQASINILVGEEDDLPNNVCEECAEKVNVCYNFKMLCEHSIAAFKRYLQLFPSNQQPTSTSPWSEDMHSSDVAELCTTDMTSSGDKITEFKISSAENNTSFSELSAEESTRKEVEKWKCSPSEDSNTFPETTMEIYIKEEKPEIEEFLPEEEKPEIEEFLPEINVSDDYIMSKNKTENITDTSLEQGDAAGRITGKSRKQYDFSYNRFMEWCSKNNVQSKCSEETLLAYFEEKSKIWKASTLWANYSMIRAGLNVNNNHDISKYYKLVAFLKQKSVGYRPKKSKILTHKQFNDFIHKAPDKEFLMLKVALIMGVFGACNREELCQMTLNNIQDMNTSLVVNTPNTNTNVQRTFSIDGEYVDIYRKYIALRPPRMTHQRLFIRYMSDRCFSQPVGKNTFGKIPSEVAKFLRLPDPELYSGHCFRRTSASLLGQ